MTRIKTLLMAMTAMFVSAAHGQKLLTLEDVMYSGDNFHNLRPDTKYMAWWGGIPAETTPEGLKNALTGEYIVTVEQLNTIAGETILRNGHAIRPDADGRTQTLISGKGKRMLIDWASKEIVWSQTEPKGAANQDLHPKSLHMAYTLEGNLYVLTKEGKRQQVSEDGSTDGTDNIVYGTSVHRDEFGISKGTFWSTDGRKLAFYRMDQSMVPSYPQVDITKRIAQTYTDHYPMAGEAGHEVKVGIYDVQTQQTTWVQTIGAKDDYHTNISWSPDGSILYIFELNRDQNHMQLVSYDARTGEKLKVVLEERHDKYVEPLNPLNFLPWDDTQAVMQSQRDGFNHLYLLNLRTGKLRQLTGGPWVVQQFVGFSPKQKALIYRANEGDPRRSCVYSVDLKGKRRLLSVDDGVHNVQLSADGQQLIDQYSSPTVPNSINLINVATGKKQNLLTATDKWAEQGYSIPEITSGSLLAADGKTPLYYRMVKPVDFDSTKVYPTVVYVYGGPHAHNVQASWRWGMRGWEAYMATKGYLLFILDNRGSEWRGRDFEQATFRHLGDVEMQDQMKGVDFLRTLPYVDANRMGVHGWSFGGYMTTNLMCTYPDAFKVGVAGGPVIDWKYYEVMYGERYMDTPQSNPEGYQNSSLLPKAKNLKGRLQIIYGMNDPTCVPQHTLSFIRAAIDGGVQPDLFTYPGGGHNMFGRDQIHLHERITRYFEDYLKNTK